VHRPRLIALLVLLVALPAAAREWGVKDFTEQVTVNPDGTVEVLAQGTRDQLSGLGSRLREGPRAARVDDVEEHEAEAIKGLNTFRIEGVW